MANFLLCAGIGPSRITSQTGLRRWRRANEVGSATVSDAKFRARRAAQGAERILRNVALKAGAGLRNKKMTIDSQAQQTSVRRGLRVALVTCSLWLGAWGGVVDGSLEGADDTVPARSAVDGGSTGGGNGDCGWFCDSDGRTLGECAAAPTMCEVALGECEVHHGGDCYTDIESACDCACEEISGNSNCFIWTKAVRGVETPSVSCIPS